MTTLAAQSRRRECKDASGHARRLPPRQSLACTSCRERKVRCDRTKPCSACCKRGTPSTCRFSVVDGTDYGPIRQASAIRNLRREVEELKEQLRDARNGHASSHEDDYPSVSRTKLCPNVSPLGRQCHEKSKSTVLMRERDENTTNSSCAGLPSIMQSSQSLVQPTAYPFPHLNTGDNSTVALTKLLPEEQDIFRSLRTFREIARSFAVPQSPDKTRENVIQDFLSNIEHNATRAPDMLALLFAALALVCHMGVAGQEAQSTRDGNEALFVRGNCYIAASMQALRNASFMSEPSLLGIKTLLIIGVDLSRTGRARDASVLFGTIVRLAYAIDLHHDPDTLTPRPPRTERLVRRSLWWLMLYSDQHLSTMLHKPLAISNIGRCSEPETLTADILELRLASVVHKFTVIAREILDRGEWIAPKEIDAQLAGLQAIWETMPDILRFETSWLRDKKALPQWPLEVASARIYADIQFLIIFLNTRETTSDPLPGGLRPTSTNGQSATRTTTNTHHTRSDSMISRSLQISACINLLHAYLFLLRCSCKVHLSHPLESRVMTATKILLTDAKVTGCRVVLPLVDEVYSGFLEMQDSHASQSAASAVECIRRTRTELFLGDIADHIQGTRCDAIPGSISS